MRLAPLMFARAFCVLATFHSGFSYAQTRQITVEPQSSPLVSIEIPGEFRDRIFISNPGIARYDIRRAIGWIYKANDPKNPTSYFKLREIPGVKVQVGQPPDTKVYERKYIIKSAVSGSLASFFGLSASAAVNDMVEIVISDNSYASIKEGDSTPCELLKSQANRQDAESLIWVYGATSSTVSSRIYRDASADAKVSGLIFAVEGKLYASQSSASIDQKVSIDYVPVAAYKNEDCTLSIMASSMIRSLSSSFARTARIGTGSDEVTDETTTKGPKFINLMLID